MMTISFSPYLLSIPQLVLQMFLLYAESGTMDFIQKLWLASFLLNLHFLYAVFDIFFRSPVVPIAEVYSNAFDLNRVIFIVADG